MKNKVWMSLFEFFDQNTFSREKVNIKRQLELDIAKSFAVILMILVHCFAFCSLCQIDTIYLQYFFIFAQCSAPLFMFAMGVGMVYTKRDSSKEFITRGIKLILMGFIINIIYFISNLYHGVSLEYCFVSLISNDILQFAGLCFILIGLFKRIRLNNNQIFFVSIIFSVIGTFVRHVSFDNIYFTQFLGHFIGTEGYKIVSCFPLLNWFIVPVAGLIFGNYLIRCTDKTGFYRRIFIPTFVLNLIFMVVGLITRYGMFSSIGGNVYKKLEYCHLSTPDALILLVAILFLVSLFYFLIPFIPRKVESLIKIISRNVTVIYIVQWALLLLLINPLNEFLHIVPSYTVAIVTIFGIIIISVVLSELYNKVKFLIINKN